MNLKTETQFCVLCRNIGITICLALAVGLLILNPLWEKYSPSFPIIRVFPAITAPVDGPFYLQNAELGYQWNTKDPLSLWFHPLLSLLISLLPDWLPDNIWFLIISLIFGIGVLFLTWQIVEIYFGNISEKLIPLILLAPAGLSFATGNPEIPCLFFNSALLLSVIKWKIWWLTISFAFLAILTKPNALYMIPILFIYFLFGIKRGDRSLWKQAFFGIIAILLGWFFWVICVDINTRELGSYWGSRILSSNFVAGNPIKYFIELANSIVYTGNLRDQLRYSTALTIPLVNFWLIGFVQFRDNVHRYALAWGNLGMFAIALLLGNPNKLIVYTTTLPGYFALFLFMFNNIFDKSWLLHSKNKYIVLPIFISYCFYLLIFYVMGTPLGWYY